MNTTSFNPFQSAFIEGFKAGSRGGQPIDVAWGSFSESPEHGVFKAMLAVAPSPPPWSAEQVEAISSFALDFHNSAKQPAHNVVERAQRIIDDMISELVYQLGESGHETDKLISPEEIRTIRDAFATIRETINNDR